MKHLALKASIIIITFLGSVNLTAAQEVSRLTREYIRIFEREVTNVLDGEKIHSEINYKNVQDEIRQIIKSEYRIVDKMDIFLELTVDKFVDKYTDVQYVQKWTDTDDGDVTASIAFTGIRPASLIVMVYDWDHDYEIEDGNNGNSIFENNKTYIGQFIFYITEYELDYD